jgi:CheY-like chemotaxis protein
VAKPALAQVDALNSKASIQLATSQATILCVEDAPDLLWIMALFLSEEGFEVVATDTAETALLRIQEHVPDLIVTDYTLPGMSGLDLCRHLRASPQTQGIPIILHTAQGIVVDPRLYNRLIQKPAELEAVAEQIRSLLGL